MTTTAGEAKSSTVGNDYVRLNGPTVTAHKPLSQNEANNIAASGAGSYYISNRSGLSNKERVMVMQGIVRQGQSNFVSSPQMEFAFTALTSLTGISQVMVLSGLIKNFIAKLVAKKMAKKGRVFWSSGGNTAVRTAAENFAAKNGMTTLEMTRAGQNLTNLTKGMTWAEQAPMWQRLSAQFAKGADGTVHVFHNSGGIGINSVWGTIEYPILRSNGINIIFHIIP